MLVETPQQESVMGLPQRARIIGREGPGHEAVQHGLDHLRLQETNLSGQGVIYYSAVIDEAISGLAIAAIGPRGDITNLVCERHHRDTRESQLA